MSNKSSYENINYRIRPAKSIERKMLCDAFRRLNEFALIESYRYVGFGSTFFSDFILFHKTLGISKMVSIEQDESNKERFELNLPFKCIEWVPGVSNEVIPKLDWDHKTIVWLDYDDSLDQDKLLDVKYLIGSMVSGSMLILSCNVHYPLGTRVERMKDALHDKMPDYLKEEDLEGWGVAKETRKIILSQIEETLMERNGIRPRGNKFKFQQLFNFNYKDNAKMLTIGGLLYEEAEEGKYLKCTFENLSFVKTSEERYLIDVPSLTYKEIRLLDTQLPSEDFSSLTLPGVKKRDIEKYAGYYRYFPNFAETEI
ncbi:MAG: O-methyltransferase [Anaerobacillus sp.]|uniref:O-methyltransferase n=1 Tax=Anaerobacillus sp. TaxID=1872506 RepID=UPI00391A9CE2